MTAGKPEPPSSRPSAPVPPRSIPEHRTTTIRGESGWGEAEKGCDDASTVAGDTNGPTAYA